jgi:hypothetical protein
LVEKSEELNKKIGDAFRSEIRESIAALSRMSDDELMEIEGQLGIEVDEDTTPQELVQALEEMADEGQTADEIAQALQESLKLSAGAAQALATDIQDAETSTEDIAEALGDTTTASKLAASQMDTAAGAVTFLKSSFDAFTFSIFTGAKPAITAFNERLANGINFINENRSAGAALGGALAGLTALAGGATLAVGGRGAKLTLAAFAKPLFATNIGAAVASAGSLSGALGALASALAPVVAAVGIAAAVVGTLVAAFFTLKEVISRDILGVGSDLAVLMERLGAVIDFLKPTVEPLIGIFVELGKILLFVASLQTVVFLMGLIKGLKLLTDVAIWTFEAIAGLINGTKTLEGVLGDAASNIVSFFSGIGSTIVAAVTSIDWTGIASSIAGAVAGLAGTAVDAITGIDWGAVGMTIIRGIAFGIGAGVGLFLKALVAYGEALVWFWTTVPGMFLDAVAAIPKLIADVIIGGLSLFVDAVVAYGEALVWFWTTVPGMFLDAVTAIPGMIADAIVAGVGLWFEAWRMYTDFLVSFWSGAGDLLLDVGGNIVEGLKNGLISAAPNVAEGIRKVVGIIRDFLPFSNAKRGPLSTIMSVGGNIVGAITKRLRAGVGLAASAASAVAGAIKGAFDSLVGGAFSLGQSIAGGIADGLKASAGAVVGAAKTVADGVKGAADFATSPGQWKQSGKALVGTVADGIKGAAGAVAGAVGGAANQAKSAVSNAARTLADPQTYKNAGKAAVSTFASGAEAAADKAQGAVKSVAEKASSALPFSEAEVGPFSNLLDRGSALVSTVAKGVKGERGTLQKAIAGVAKGSPFGAAAEGIVGAIGGGSGPRTSGGTGRGPAAGRPIEIVLEQTNNFGNVDREDVRRRVQEATRAGGQDALAELELLLRQALAEVEA